MSSKKKFHESFFCGFLSIFVHFSVLDTVPFEVSETGWGEFEVQIKLYFIDVNEKPVNFIFIIFFDR